ncbi:MAG: acyl-CoA dehydrogenase, partial [Pseudomonadota bacterium]
MAHDGQLQIETALIPGLLQLTGESVAPAEALLETAKARVAAMVSENGRVSGALVDAHQTAAHGFAWLATYVESLRQMQAWAEKLDAEGTFGETEQLIHQIAFGEYLWQIYGGLQMNQGEVVRPQDLGLTQEDQRALMTPAVMTLCNEGNSQAARLRLVELMQEQGGTIVGRSGLDEELEMIREQFRRYAVEKVEPFAHEWHLKDELIPMETTHIDAFDRPRPPCSSG